MSDYEKPVKKCVDAPLGIRAVNAIAESQDAQKQLLDVEHVGVFEEAPFIPNFGNIAGGKLTLQPAPSPGEHDTPKVARGTISLDIDPNGLFATPGNPVQGVNYKSGVCRSFVRVEEGLYFFPIEGLTDFYGEATPKAADNTTTRRCETYSAVNLTPATVQQPTTVPGVYVRLYEETTLDSSNVGFDVADFGFDLTIYGNRDLDLTPPFVAPVYSRAVAQRRRWHPRSRIVQPF